MFFEVVSIALGVAAGLFIIASLVMLLAILFRLGLLILEVKVDPWLEAIEERMKK